MDRADVIIFGGGLVGLALAAALDSSGLSAIVVDPADPAQRKGAAFDGRTSAVSSSSMRMLKTIGVADHLAEAGCPIRRIAVADGLDPGGLHFDDVTARRVTCRRARRIARLTPGECGLGDGSCRVGRFQCVVAQAFPELRFVRCSRFGEGDPLFKTIRFEFGS